MGQAGTLKPGGSRGRLRHMPNRRGRPIGKLCRSWLSATPRSITSRVDVTALPSAPLRTEDCFYKGMGYRVYSLYPVPSHPYWCQCGFNLICYNCAAVGCVPHWPTYVQAVGCGRACAGADAAQRRGMGHGCGLATGQPQAGARLCGSLSAHTSAALVSSSRLAQPHA